MSPERRTIEPAALLATLEELKAGGYDYLSCVSGVDYPDQDVLEVVYHLFATSEPRPPMVLQVRTPRNEPEVPSAVNLYRSADLQEREIFDLLGVRFQGHPNLTRLLLWEEFQGHPLRKDFQPEDEDRPVREGSHA